MKTLPTTFKKNGFVFRQLQREGMVALFEKWKPLTTQITYEVVIVQSHNGYTIAGKFIEPAETMPSSESWGTHGWTFIDFESAKAKFNALVDASAAKTTIPPHPTPKNLASANANCKEP